MNYQVLRNGQMYGPYTLDDLQRYVASGNVLASDLAKSEGMTDWIPVSQVLGAQAASPPPQLFAGSGYASPASAYDPTAGSMASASSAYPDAPNLHWGLVLLFSLLTCGLFIYVWDLVQSSWMRRVDPNSTSLFYYIGACVLVVGYWGASFVAAMQHEQPGALAGVLFLALAVVILVARFSLRASLEKHFNGPEPVGLQLGGVMTFFFGTFYFQYHLNRINAIKQAARQGAGRAY